MQAPRSPHDRVYVLPLLTIKMNKGTGAPPTTNHTIIVITLSEPMSDRLAQQATDMSLCYVPYKACEHCGFGAGAQSAVLLYAQLPLLAPFTAIPMLRRGFDMSAAECQVYFASCTFSQMCVTPHSSFSLRPPVLEIVNCCECTIPNNLCSLICCMAGVVMGCPSDSPDDYTALQELKAKPKLREKFSVQDSWVEFDVSSALLTASKPPCCCCSIAACH